MYEFKIESLNCMSCFHNIEDALKEADSTINANVNIKKKVLTVESKLTVDELKKLIEAAGYPVSESLKS
jgi:copper chaperone CopZ